MVPMCWGEVAGYGIPMCWGEVAGYGTHVLGWSSWLWYPCVGVEELAMVLIHLIWSCHVMCYVLIIM